MFRFFSSNGMLRWLGRWGCAAALLACLGLSGCCKTVNLRGENFADNGLADQCRSYRSPDKNNEVFGASNKAIQIERDLGVQ